MATHLEFVLPDSMRLNEMYNSTLEAIKGTEKSINNSIKVLKDNGISVEGKADIKQIDEIWLRRIIDKYAAAFQGGRDVFVPDSLQKNIRDSYQKVFDTCRESAKYIGNAREMYPFRYTYQQGVFAYVPEEVESYLERVSTVEFTPEFKEAYNEYKKAEKAFMDLYAWEQEHGWRRFSFTPSLNHFNMTFYDVINPNKMAFPNGLTPEAFLSLVESWAIGKPMCAIKD